MVLVQNSPSMDADMQDTFPGTVGPTSGPARKAQAILGLREKRSRNRLTKTIRSDSASVSLDQEPQAEWKRMEAGVDASGLISADSRRARMDDMAQRFLPQSHDSTRRNDRIANGATVLPDHVPAGTARALGHEKSASVSHSTLNEKSRLHELELKHLKLPLGRSRSNRTFRMGPDRSGKSTPTKKFDFTSLFPRSKSAGRLIAPPAIISGPLEAMTEEASAAQRERVFTRDDYDGRKTNVRRPPKGIQNWFDGLDSDSDEELSAAGSDSESQVLAPSSDDTSISRCSTPASLCDLQGSSAPGKAQLPATIFVPAKPSQDALSSLSDGDRFSHSNLIPIVYQRQPQTPDEPILADDPPIEATGNGTVTASALGLSGLENEDAGAQVNDDTGSCLSFSDSEGEDYADASLTMVKHASASTMVIQRPTSPPRQVVHSPTPKMSPKRFSNPPSLTGSSAQSIGSRELGDSPTLSSVAPNTAAKKANNDRDDSNRSRPSLVRQPSVNERSSEVESNPFEDRSSVGDTASSNSLRSGAVNANRLMAVTAEEMALLELMRNRRAQKKGNVSAEDYSDGLRDALMKNKVSRYSAQILASEITKRNGFAGAELDGTPAATPSAASSSVISVPSIQETADSASATEDLPAAQQHAKAARIESFLRKQPPVSEQYPTSLPGTRPQSAALSGEPAPMSLSHFEEALADTNKKIHSLQRLTERLTEALPAPVRAALETTNEDEGRRHLQTARTPVRSPLRRPTSVRSFSLPSSCSPTRTRQLHTTHEEDGEDAATDSYFHRFPSPPSSTNGQSRRRPGRMSLLDNPVLEEEPIPDMSSPYHASTRTGGDSIVDRSAIASHDGVSPIYELDGASAVATPSDASGRGTSVPLTSYFSASTGSWPLTPTSDLPSPLSGGPTSPAATIDTIGLAQTVGADGAASRTISPAVARLSSQSRTKQSLGRAAGRVTSMESISSASEDVLAAWADLGGNNDVSALRQQCARASKIGAYHGM